MKFHELLAGATATLLLASSVAAQTADSAPSRITMDHARHLTQTMHIQRTMDGVLPAILRSMTDSLSQDKSPATMEQAHAMDDAIAIEFHDFTPKFVDSAAAVYARIYTNEEMTEMDRFYSSPVGQSVLAKAPEASKLLMPSMMAELPALMHRAMDRYCDKAHCTVEVRAALEKVGDNMGPKRQN